MRFIPTRVHAATDYVVGLFVAVLPILFGIEGNASMALMALGVLAIVYSLFTDYELGVVPYLRLRFHLALDAIFCGAMLVLPSAFSLPSDAQLPVYTIGLLALALVLTTEIRAEGTAS